MKQTKDTSWRYDCNKEQGKMTTTGCRLCKMLFRQLHKKQLAVKEQSIQEERERIIKLLDTFKHRCLWSDESVNKLIQQIEEKQ